MRNAPFLLLLLLAAGCNNNRAMIPPEEPPHAAVADTTHATDEASSTDTTADTTAATDSARLAKRLEELDRRIAAAPPDSIQALDAEYRRVIDSALAAEGKQVTVSTGPETTQPEPANQPTESTVRRQPNDTAATVATAVPEATPTTSEVRRQPAGSGASTATEGSAIDDPGAVFKGLRPDELRTAPAYQNRSTNQKPNAPTRSQTRRSNSRKAQPPAATAKRSKRQRTAPVIQERESDEQREAITSPSPAVTRDESERQLQRKYIDGVASARAGNYADAAAKLEPVVNSATLKAHREEARYYYARSLEGLGRTSEALRNYNTISNGSGGLKHRAYLDYCRLLAANGQKERARTMLRQFIRRNPNSRQTPDAQALLQTL